MIIGTNVWALQPNKGRRKMKYIVISLSLLATACASHSQKLEGKIEDFNVIVGSYCRDGKPPRWFHNGENYYFITCADGQTFSIKKD